MLTGFEWFGLIVLFVLGAVFGSFANVVIWRLPRGESLSTPGSHCPRCSHPIRWYDNVPLLGWLILRGRCRDCGEPISVRYLSVELLSGILWLSAGLHYGLTVTSLSAAYMLYILMVLSMIDLDTMRLPNPLVGLLAAGGLAGAVVARITGLPVVPLTPGGGLFADPLIAAALGSLSGGGVALGIAAAYRGVRGQSGFGMGDVKLLLALGPFLGVYNVMVLFIGSMLGAAAGLFVASRSDSGLRVKMPFGPFLAIAAVIVALYGPSMWTWYTHLVGM